MFRSHTVHIHGTVIYVQFRLLPGGGLLDTPRWSLDMSASVRSHKLCLKHHLIETWTQSWSIYIYSIYISPCKGEGRGLRHLIFRDGLEDQVLIVHRQCISVGSWSQQWACCCGPSVYLFSCSSDKGCTP